MAVNSPTDIPGDLATALSARYDLRSVLGRGGMATVYMAYDRKHQRDVALKVMRPEIAATIGADRFLKEIQIVARLVHPHILTLHDSGDADGFIYYVMPYIDGGSLRDFMERERRVSVERALSIAEPIADALNYAHQCGVLHRDIKPENVLFARSHPIVADFGIAKAVTSASSGAALTRTGISLGTPGYMSPEQAAGFTEVDARTDVYSLAILVYEMIAGGIPGKWVGEESTRAARFLDAPSQHRPQLAAAGSAVEAAMVRALALRPDQRTPTPQDFIDDLRGKSKAGRRKYRPDEIEKIVGRAAEIEATNPTSSGSMTIGGVEQVAREVGIDRRHVQSALAELSPRGAITRDLSITPPKPSILAGARTRLLYERVIDGELAESDYPILADEMRIQLGEVGAVSQLGTSFSWTVNRGANSPTQIEIVVSARRGKTRIVAQENLGALTGVVFGGMGGGLGGGLGGPLMAALFAGLKVEPAAALLVVPSWLTLVYSVTRMTYYYAVKRREKRLEQLMNRLAEICRELIGDEPRRLTSGSDG